jgi:cyclic pyranopterin phosphate synthase
LDFVDGFGRVHDDLRLSITDRCNLRCAYCMPEEPVWFPRASLLTFEETTRVARIALRHGVRKLRVTGGEPLVRRDAPALVAALAALPGLDDLSLTTNGVLLGPLARDLAAAGLRRINVSLDTLDRARFARMSGRDRLPDVLAGLVAAREAGLQPIKINAVLLRGENEDEATALAAFGRRVRKDSRSFSRVHAPGQRPHWDPGRVVSGASLRTAIGRQWAIERDPAEDPHAPASRFLYAQKKVVCVLQDVLCAIAIDSVTWSHRGLHRRQCRPSIYLCHVNTDASRFGQFQRLPAT